MDEKKKRSAEREPVKKWQMILQWICAALWIIAVIFDLLGKQNLFLTITQSVAAACFLASAIILTVRYRKSPHDAGQN